MIAAASVQGDGPVASYLAMVGFVDPPVKSSTGVYTLTLSNPPPAQFQAIISVAPFGPGPSREVVATHLAAPALIQINMFDSAGVPADRSFNIVVHQAPLFP